MKSIMNFKKILLLAILAINAMFFSLGTSSAETILNVATAGSQNMVDYVRFYLAPKFEVSHPGVKVKTVGTGAGDSGSQKIFEKLEAQKKSGATVVDLSECQWLCFSYVPQPNRYCLQFRFGQRSSFQLRRFGQMDRKTSKTVWL